MSNIININFTHRDVTATSNIANAPSPIMSVRVPLKQIYKIKNGMLIRTKLRVDATTEISPSSEFIFAIQRPTDFIPTPISSPMTYEPFFLTSLDLQVDRERQEFMRVNLDVEEVHITAETRLIVMLLSPQVVSIANSSMAFELEAI